MCVLASTSVPFRPTTVQMLSLALIDMKQITVQLVITSCEDSMRFLQFEKFQVEGVWDWKPLLCMYIEGTESRNIIFWKVF
jgi:hypothetical protein